MSAPLMPPITGRIFPVVDRLEPRPGGVALGAGSGSDRVISRWVRRLRQRTPSTSVGRGGRDPPQAGASRRSVRLVAPTTSTRRGWGAGGRSSFCATGPPPPGRWPRGRPALRHQVLERQRLRLVQGTSGPPPLPAMRRISWSRSPVLAPTLEVRFITSRGRRSPRWRRVASALGELGLAGAGVPRRAGRTWGGATPVAYDSWLATASAKASAAASWPAVKAADVLESDGGIDLRLHRPVDRRTFRRAWCKDVLEAALQGPLQIVGRQA